MPRRSSPSRRIVSGMRNRLVDRKPAAVSALAIGAEALGGLALGALAVGALALGALAIGSVVVGRARIRRLEIDELVVRKLRITDELSLPSSPAASRGDDGAAGSVRGSSEPPSASP